MKKLILSGLATAALATAAWAFVGSTTDCCANSASETCCAGGSTDCCGLGGGCCAK